MRIDLPGRIVELADNFFLITAPNKSRFPFCNTFLLAGRANVMIDAGLDPETLQAVDRWKRIDTLIITHSHPDHILNWHLLSDRRILMPVETPDAVKDLNALGTRFMGDPEKGAYWVKIVGDGLGLQPLRDPDGRFGNGDLLEVDGFRLRAVHAPGHLNDHYVFFEERTGILMSSDIDFSGFGPFYGQPECDIDKFMASIKTVMALPYTRVCSSHKMPIDGDAEQAFLSFLNGFQRLRDALADICRTPHTLDQIVVQSPVYRDRMPDKLLQHTFEKGMISKTLDRMVRAGAIRQDGEYYVTAG